MMRMSISPRFGIHVPALLMLSLFAACQEPIVVPARHAGPARFHQAAAAIGPVHHSIIEKYREQTHAFAKGHGRVATVSSRALLGKDGVTTIDLTTGTLDVPGAPGQFDKITMQPDAGAKKKGKKIMANKVNAPTFTTTFAST